MYQSAGSALGDVSRVRTVWWVINHALDLAEPRLFTAHGGAPEWRVDPDLKYPCHRSSWQASLSNVITLEALQHLSIRLHTTHPATPSLFFKHSFPYL